MEKPPPGHHLAYICHAEAVKLTMTVINHNIRFLILITNHPYPMKTRLLDLLPRDSRFQISMPQHTKPEKRQRNTLGKENFTNGSRNFGKSIANTADDKVLEGSGVLVESRFLMFWGEEAFGDELVWELEYWRQVLVVFGDRNERTYGRRVRP
jgi:hypothetical protein